MSCFLNSRSRYPSCHLASPLKSKSELLLKEISWICIHLLPSQSIPLPVLFLPASGITVYTIPIPSDHLLLLYELSSRHKHLPPGLFQSCLTGLSALISLESSLYMMAKEYFKKSKLHLIFCYSVLSNGFLFHSEYISKI